MRMFGGGGSSMEEDPRPLEYDDIIVGGGSAGAVLAARLSEDPARKVMLLEAGPDYATVELTPADLRNCWRMSLREHDWGFTAEAVPGRAIPYPRGRVVGGSSAVNAAIALRGVPADYDEWASLGNDAWSWEKVLPYFRRLEDDPDGAAEVHGRDGPPRLPGGRRPQPPRRDRRRLVPPEPARPPADLDRDRLLAPRA